jgi:hypothetical protein
MKVRGFRGEDELSLLYHFTESCKSLMLIPEREKPKSCCASFQRIYF